MALILLTKYNLITLPLRSTAVPKNPSSTSSLIQLLPMPTSCLLMPPTGGQNAVATRSSLKPLLPPYLNPLPANLEAIVVG